MDEDPIEILVGLAERGEIDPWNIDIVEVTDRFLSELERRRQLDLRVSGRTLFYAATLLRIKSECLGEQDHEEEPDTMDELDSELDFGDECFSDPVERLEREIGRRLERRPMRQVPVTLYELIQLLKTAEKADRRRTRAHRPKDTAAVLAEDIVSIAHREDYRETASKVLEALRALELQFRERITLEELRSSLGWSLADIYLPLLFLALDGMVSLWQKEFFSELYILAGRDANCIPNGAGEVEPQASNSMGNF